MAEDLESLRTSFNRSLRVEGKADRTLVLYGQSITYFADWLRQRGQPTDLSSLDRLAKEHCGRPSRKAPVTATSSRAPTNESTNHTLPTLRAS